jgi:hypothetical protein
MEIPGEDKAVALKDDLKAVRDFHGAISSDRGSRIGTLPSNPSDLLALPFENGSIQPFSCMHVVEHVGLGRYGDRLDPDGDLKAIAELKRVLSIAGTLLFVVPVGKPRVMFNAHRIYSYRQIMGYFDGLDLVEFALIPDRHDEGDLVYGASEEITARQNYTFGCSG